MLQNLLGGLSQESTQQSALDQLTYLLAAILDKLPRIDNADRLVVNTADQGNVTVAIAADVARLNNLGSFGTSKPADAMPLHMSHAGVMHIYNNLIVS